MDGQGGGRCISNGVCCGRLWTRAVLSVPVCIWQSAHQAEQYDLPADTGCLCAAPDGRKEARPQSLRAASEHEDGAAVPE